MITPAELFNLFNESKIDDRYINRINALKAKDFNTEIIENQISGIEGIKTISSVSRDGRSKITIEFVYEKNINEAKLININLINCLIKTFVIIIMAKRRP